MWGILKMVYPKVNVCASADWVKTFCNIRPNIPKECNRVKVLASKISRVRQFIKEIS